MRHEMNVFETDKPELYLLQFPLRPAVAPEINLTDAYIKPKHKVLEIHCAHVEKSDAVLKLSSTTVLNRASLVVGNLTISLSKGTMNV